MRTYQGTYTIDAKASIDFGPTYNGSIVDDVDFDPIGLPVDRCARLNSFAKKNEIVFSEDFLSLVEKKSSRNGFRRKYGYDICSEDIKGVGRTKYFGIST